MNKFSIMKLANKIVGLIRKPVSMFFGSDEKAWVTLTSACAVLYFMGLPDAAIIAAVYSTVFAVSGMQKYDTGGGDNGGEEFDEIQDMMDDALGMAEEFQEKTEKDEEVEG